jgi:hypothetical protein
MAWRPMVKSLGRFDKAEVEAIRQTVQRMGDEPDALQSLRYFSAASAFKAS